MADAGIEPELRIALDGGPECAFRFEMIRFTDDGPDVLWHAFLQDGERISGETKLDGYPLPDSEGIFGLIRGTDARLRGYAVAPGERVLD